MRAYRRVSRVAAVFLLLPLFLLGCAQEELLIVHNERESTRILSLLALYGLPAESSVRDNGARILTVRTEDRSRALELLSEYGLPDTPKSEESSLLSSFLPLSQEESFGKGVRNKLDDLEQSIELFPGVISVGFAPPVISPERAGVPKTLKLSMVLRLLPTARTLEIQESVTKLVKSSFSESVELTMSIPRVQISSREESRKEELVELFFPFPFHVPLSEVRNVQLQVYTLFGTGTVLSLIVGLFVGADFMRRKMLAGRVPRTTFDRLQDIAKQAEFQTKRGRRARLGTGSVPAIQTEGSTENE